NVKMLAVLFERYHVKMYNYFLRLTGNKSVSEDLTQEVFLRILKYRDTFRHESKFTTWMYKIGRNVHIDYLRKYKEEMPLEEKWEEEIAAESQPEQKTQEEQDMVFLHRALSQLTPAKKEVLVLSRFQGMKYQEISQLLGCSLSTVKVQVHRAIKDLREKKKVPGKLLMNKLGAKAVAFIDDIFLLPGKKGAERVKQIADIMERYSFKWAFGCRPPDLTEEIASYCRVRGLKNVAMEVLLHFNKKTTVADSRRAIEICRKFDLSITPYFIMFEPDMTMDDVKKNIDFLAEYGLLWPLPASNILVPYPGTPVYKALNKQNRIIENNNQFKMLFKNPGVEQFMNRVVSTLRKAIHLEFKLKEMEFVTDLDESPDYVPKRQKVRAFLDEMSSVTWNFMNNSINNPECDYSDDFLEKINRIDIGIWNWPVP
ncbi:MAG: sigma-70 family RNA polymerase sigma factor, partial [Candidatus Aminicenantes bacterium]